MVIADPSVFLKYPALARAALDGTLPAERLLDVSPLYFHLHVAAHGLLRDPLPWLRGAQLAATSGAGVLLFMLLRQQLSLWLALLGVLAFALDRSLAIYAALLEPEPWLLLLLLGFVVGALRPGRVSQWLAGLCFGLTLWVRASFLPVALLYPLVVCWLTPEAHVRRRRLLSFFAPVLLSVGLLLARNALVVGDATLMGMNPGTVFFEGNNPLSWGQSAVYPPLVNELAEDLTHSPDPHHDAYRLVARRAAGHALSPDLVNELWSARATAFIADHPGRFARSLLLKGYFYLHTTGRHDILLALLRERALERWPLPVLPFGLTASLALIGMVLGLRRLRALLLLYLVTLSHLGVALVFYVSARQRISVLPFFVFFAALAIDRLARKRAHLLVGLAAAAGLAAVLSWSPTLLRDERHLWEATYASARLMEESAALRDRRELDQAAERSARALARAPFLLDGRRLAELPFGPEGFFSRSLHAATALPAQTPSARLDRALLLLTAGELDRAEAELTALQREGRRFNRIYLGPSLPEHYLGRIALLRGNPARARAQFQAALTRTPGDPFALASLATLQEGGAHRALLERYYGPLDADLLIGRALLEAGHAQAAIEPLSSLVQHLPEYRRGKLYLAVALARAGELDPAADLFMRAVEQQPEPLPFEDDFVSLFERLSAAHPQEPAVQYNHGVVLRRYGRLEQARAVQRQVLAQVPAQEEVLAELRYVETLLDAADGASAPPRSAAPPRRQATRPEPQAQ